MRIGERNYRQEKKNYLSMLSELSQLWYYLDVSEAYSRKEMTHENFMK